METDMSGIILKINAWSKQPSDLSESTFLPIFPYISLYLKEHFNDLRIIITVTYENNLLVTFYFMIVAESHMAGFGDIRVTTVGEKELHNWLWF